MYVIFVCMGIKFWKCTKYSGLAFYVKVVKL